MVANGPVKPDGPSSKIVEDPDLGVSIFFFLEDGLWDFFLGEGPSIYVFLISSTFQIMVISLLITGTFWIDAKM